MIPRHVWVYRARVENVVDGDTLDLFVDAGFRQYTAQRARLYGVDTPEMRGPERVQGQAAKRWVIEWLGSGGEAWPYVIRTERDPDNFGRYLVTLWRGDGRCLNEDLVTEGIAEVWT